MKRIITFIKTKKKLIIIILFFLLVLGFLGWWIWGKKNQKPTYTTAQVEKGTIVSTISATGNLIQTNTFAVTTQVTGVVKEVFVKEDEEVKKGQKLVEITLDESGEQAKTKAWASYLSAKNTLDNAKDNALQNKLSLEKELASAKDSLTTVEQSKLNLLQALYKAESDLITAKNDFSAVESKSAEDTDRQIKELALKSAQAAYDLAKQKYDSAGSLVETAQKGLNTSKQKYEDADDANNRAINKAEADLSVASLAYKLTLPVITAPQGGKVSDISVAEGMILSSSSTSGNQTSSDTSGSQTSGSQKLLSIVGEQKPMVNVSVSEIDIGKITFDQKATVTFDSLPDKTFTGKIVGVDRTGSETQGVVNYSVLIQLDTGEEQLYPKMAATAEIITEVRENALWVPPQAVKKQNGQTIVSILVGGNSEEKQVEIGLEITTQTEIKSGLSEGETIIVSEQTQGGATSTFGGGGSFRGIIPGGFGGERK